MLFNIYTTQTTEESSHKPKVAKLEEHLQALTRLINSEDGQSVVFVRAHTIG